MVEFIALFFNYGYKFVYVFATIFTVLTWWKARRIQKLQAERDARNRTPIIIALVAPDGNELQLRYMPRRDQLSRSEVAGCIGLYAGKRSFQLPGLLTIFESGHFSDVLEGKTDKLCIPCDQEEWDRFSNDFRRVGIPVDPSQKQTEADDNTATFNLTENANGHDKTPDKKELQYENPH